MRTEECLPIVVFVPRGTKTYAAARSIRALQRLGVDASIVHEDELAREIVRVHRPLWLLRAGAWPLALPHRPPPSATGRTLLALGATHAEPRWTEILARTGGDLTRATELPRIDSAIVDEPHRLAHRLSATRAFDEACAELAIATATRTVRFPRLDVGYFAGLRVVEVVTTLHRGGAERVVLDLVRELRVREAHVTLAVLDAASRATFPTPAGTVDLTASGSTRAARIDALGSLAHEEHADVVHLHLVDGAEIQKLAAACDVPLALTLHNDRPGWAARTTELGPDHVALVFGCSSDVARAFADACPSLASRTRVAWNGIAEHSSPRDHVSLREELDIPEGAVLLLSVANHRPQKRLEQIPAVVASLVRRGVDAHAVLIGEPVSKDPVALAVAASVDAAAAEHGVTERVHLAGTRDDVAPLYAAADVVVTTSAFEGLSLVQLEAMRARKPLVTTAVSGTADIAAFHPGAVHRVDVDASADAFADAVRAALPGAPERLASAFASSAMGARYAALLARAAPPPRRTSGIVLVANNFATGGAQSSARRLLLGLRARGVDVSAVVVQEQAGHPTAGREALVRAGIPVFAAPRAGAVDPLVTAEAVARFVDRAAPSAVVFWNVITQHKVLVAELLAGTPVWDVSPGEMYFASMDRYFEKPRAGHPVREARAYGRLLEGAVVKYAAERAQAESVLGVPVHVVPNGVPLGASRPLRSSGDRLVVGTLARINPDKKLEELVRAVAHLARRDPDLARRLDVRIAGAVEEGCEPYLEELRALAFGLPITFVGEQPATAFLRDLDLFAMISEPSGCPNASLEAMAEGLAVVATDVGGAREQIAHGETGFLVGRGDAEALGDAIASLALQPERRAAVGAAAHARIRALFSVERMVADYARLLLGEDAADAAVA